MPSDGRRRYDIDRAKGIVDQAVRLPYADPREADRQAADAERWFLAQYGLEKTVQHDKPTPCDYSMWVWGVRSMVQVHLDVKSSPRQDQQLIKKKDDIKDTHWCTAYVLVIGQIGGWRVAGWQWGFELQKHWNTALPKPAWALPQDALRMNVDILMAATFGATRV